MSDNKTQMPEVRKAGPGLFAGQSIAVVGASSGIGRACALRLSLLGATIACLDRDIEDCEETVAQIRSAGGDSWAMRIDISNMDSVVTVMAETISRLGVLDCVLNTAGITGITDIPTHDVDVDDFDRVYLVNLRGAFALSKVVLPHMVERGYGRILHIASIAGKEGNAGMAAYSSTKAGLIGLVKTMGKEYATTGVTVNAIAPAVIQTPMVEALPQAQIDYMTKQIPMARTCTLKEVAEMASFVLSSECSFTTGFTFDLTGGRAVY